MITKALKTGRGRLLSAAMLSLVCAAAYLAVAIGTGALAVSEGPLTGHSPLHWLVTGTLSYFIVDTLRLIRESVLWTISGAKFVRGHARRLNRKWVAFKAARALPAVAGAHPRRASPRSPSAARAVAPHGSLDRRPLPHRLA